MFRALSHLQPVFRLEWKKAPPQRQPPLCLSNAGNASIVQMTFDYPTCPAGTKSLKLNTLFSLLTWRAACWCTCTQQDRAQGHSAGTCVTCVRTSSTHLHPHRPTSTHVHLDQTHQQDTPNTGTGQQSATGYRDTHTTISLLPITLTAKEEQREHANSTQLALNRLTRRIEPGTSMLWGDSDRWLA